MSVYVAPFSEDTKMLNINNIPEELKKHNQFLLYKNEPRENGKTNKIPISYKYLSKISIKDEKNLCSFDEAKKSYEQNQSTVAGIGFSFLETDDIVFIDIDNCVKEDESGYEIDDNAKDIVGKMNSYTEISPSKRGLHIFVQCKDPSFIQHNRKGTIEIYYKDRYSTLTGDCLSGFETIQERSAEVYDFYNTVFEEQESHIERPKSTISTIDDNKVLELLAKDNKFQAILSGDASYNSRSERDFAAISKVLFYAGGNEEQTERLLRSYKDLVRDKWEERRGNSTWLQSQISACNSLMTDYYAPLFHQKNTSPDTDTDESNMMKKLSSICFTGGSLEKMKFKSDIFYLYPLIKKNSVNLISGEAGAGKTLFMLSICKSIHEHKDFLHFESRTDETPKILFIDGEMGKEELQKRLSRMMYWNDEFILLSKNECYDNNIEPINISNADCQKTLIELFGRLKPDIIIFDNLFNLTDIDHNSSKEYQTINNFFSRLKKNHTIFCIHHTNKGNKDYYGSVSHITNVDTHYIINKITMNDSSICIKFGNTKYRPLLDDGKDREKIGEQRILYNEVLQQWEYVSGHKSDTGEKGKDRDLIRMICTFSTEKNIRKYTYEEISKNFGGTQRSIKSKKEKFEKQGIIYSENNNKRYLTEKGYREYFQDANSSGYKIKAVTGTGDAKRFFFTDEEDIDTPLIAMERESTWSCTF
ncbi:MAG TPA: AAA family ATPase [Syntrophales bacterium]|nr:AAA family ATPase [Syntrophales bacterium]